MNIRLAGEELELHPQRGVYWRARKVLMVADLHLGKVNHFRRHGFPVPQKANDHNLESLVELMQQTRPERMICLGDLFHSHYNSEWEMFGELIRYFPSIRFELVIGNHDIMSDLQYMRKGIQVYKELKLGPFVLTHHPKTETDKLAYNLAGHVHPGVTLSGKGRQSMTLPCFYFGEQQGFLPAFGKFTGIARIRPKKDDQVYVIAENKIITLT